MWNRCQATDDWSEPLKVIIITVILFLTGVSLCRAEVPFPRIEHTISFGRYFRGIISGEGVNKLPGIISNYDYTKRKNKMIESARRTSGTWSQWEVEPGVHMVFFVAEPATQVDFSIHATEPTVKGFFRPVSRNSYFLVTNSSEASLVNQRWQILVHSGKQDWGSTLADSKSTILRRPDLLCTITIPGSVSISDYVVITGHAVIPAVAPIPVSKTQFSNRTIDLESEAFHFVIRPKR